MDYAAIIKNNHERVAARTAAARLEDAQNPGTTKTTTQLADIFLSDKAPIVRAYEEGFLKKLDEAATLGFKNRQVLSHHKATITRAHSSPITILPSSKILQKAFQPSTAVALKDKLMRGAGTLKAATWDDKSTLAKLSNGAIIASVALVGLPATFNQVSGSPYSVRVELPAEPTYCSPAAPMVVETPLGKFFETDSNFCKRVLQTLPAPSKHFTQYNENIGVRALKDGSFEFRLVTFKAGTQSFDDLLEGYSKGSLFGIGNVRQAYIDTYRFKTNDSIETTKEIFEQADLYVSAKRAKSAGLVYSEHNLELGNSKQVKNAVSFRQSHSIDSYGVNPISAENYRAIDGAWLISPLPFSFYLAKWNRESGFNNKAQSGTGSARGLNQFTIATFLTAVKKYGRQMGLTKLHEDVTAIATYKNKEGKTVVRNDKDTIKDTRFIKLFHDASINPNYSTALGVLNTASKIERLQAAVDKGEIRLRGGRSKLNEGEAYLGHYLGDNAKLVLNTLDSNPHALMADIVPSDVYSRNKNDFKNLTVEDYYNRLLRKFGFGSREIDVSAWFKEGHGRSFASNVNKREVINPGDIGTKFKIVVSSNASKDVLALQERPNVSWMHIRYKGVAVELVPATNPAPK